ncbi:MAG: hypothetical protein IT573_07625 [Deltaproteobacteria bacterium]|nr:hypothetical protein [Deltaproteobacteria bacterium]
MSDIGLPAGITFFLLGLGLAALAFLLMAAFLLAAALGRKELPYSKRPAFGMFLGMLFPLGAGLLLMAWAEFAPWDLRRQSDLWPAAVLWSIPFFPLAFGLAWGIRRARGAR